MKKEMEKNMYVAKFNESNLKMSTGHRACQILSEEISGMAGVSTGMSIYFTETYSTPGIHEDHEGFFVVEGDGWVKMGEDEFSVSSGTSFLVPAGTAHAICKKTGGVDVKIFWFHFPQAKKGILTESI